MTYCNKCGAEPKEGAKFCNKCGNKIRQVASHKESEHKSDVGKKGHCNKCGAKLISAEKFCGECGHERTETGAKALPKISPAALPWVILIGILIAAGTILIPTKTIAYQVEIPYIDKEQYTVEVPYEDVEEYVEQVPYETTEQYAERIPVQEEQESVEQQCRYEYLNYNIQWVNCKAGWFFGNGEATLSVHNADSEAGQFTFKVGYVDEDGSFYGAPMTKTIMAGRSETFTYEISDTSIQNCKYEAVSIPQKQVCELYKTSKPVTSYKDIIKIRAVTKYRDETKYRKVTRTRTETREREVRKTKTETRYKKVNWLFGFEVPW